MGVRKHWRIFSFLVLFGIAGLAASGCRNRGGSVEDGGGEPGVMARVNGYDVQRAEFDRAYNSQIAGAPQKPAGIQEEALRLQILDQIIQTRLILQRADQLGIKVSNDEVQDKLTDSKKPYTVEQFQKQLKNAGLSEDDYKTYLSHGLVVDKVMAKEITPKLTIADADVNAFYDQNKARLPAGADEAQVKQQIRNKLRSELEQILKAAYGEQLRNHAEIHNYYVEEVLQNHKAEAR